MSRWANSSGSTPKAVTSWPGSPNYRRNLSLFIVLMLSFGAFAVHSLPRRGPCIVFLVLYIFDEKEIRVNDSV